MMDGLMQGGTGTIVTLLLALVLFVSVWQGVSRGASGSMQHLFFFALHAVLTLASMFIAYQLANQLSPIVVEWIKEMQLTVPAEPSWWERSYLAVMTSIRDFDFMRVLLLFVVMYFVVRLLLNVVERLLILIWVPSSNELDEPHLRTKQRTWPHRLLSRTIGAVVGVVTGAIRVVIIVAVLFGVVTLQPSGGFSRAIQASDLYQEVSNRIVKPVAGSWITEKLPVLSSQVERQFKEMMHRRYEVIDQQIPQNIEQAAVKITEGAASDKEKARKLYDWIGTRIQYDWDKANNYLDKGVWKEQSPADTFKEKAGVCIDYARLYAMMARTVDLQVKVITGLGYDGKGGYGPHAWNSVYLTEEEKWILLDTTWASTGDWFDRPDFSKTHIPD
ncbi:transglutaminase domain-containing protein [Paenibacillus agilis]|nr:transglutaminase domain-containing protein [Paenibacillus agilis]